MPTGTSKLFSVQVILLLLINSSTNKEQPNKQTSKQKTQQNPKQAGKKNPTYLWLPKSIGKKMRKKNSTH